MKIINEYTSERYNIVRTYDKGHNIVRVYTTETACNWYVTIKVWGYALPSVEAWKVSKREAKTREEAETAIINEAIKRGNL